MEEIRFFAITVVCYIIGMTIAVLFVNIFMSKDD